MEEGHHTAMMPKFVPGLELAERFYRDAVRPILNTKCPGLSHSAGLIGAGSEVLGFDTPVSSDHHWGPRVQLFVTEDAYVQHADAILEVLRQTLPHTFLGWPTSFTEPNPDDHGTQLLRATTSGPVNHRADVTTPRRFFLHYLGFDLREALDPIDWLTWPSQKLRSIVASELFHDAIGLDDVRRRFDWYPQDVWLYLLASGWQRIGQQEHLMGRAGQAGDEVGSALIASQLVRDLMRLWFLMERQYAPYAKWYGTAFAQLKSASALTPLFSHALRADTWLERDRALGGAYSIVAAAQNALAMSETQPADAQRFFGRPFSVIFGERFAKALRARIEDSSVKQIPLLIGRIDQLTDSTDVLEATAFRVRLKALYHRAQ